MNNFDNLVQMLYEEINDSSAIVYHRTGNGENLWNDLINGKQFVPGNGDYYGKGFYSTYDIESQMRGSMKMYGDNILKAKIKGLQNFFIFDPEIYKSVNHKDPKNMFREQTDRFNIRNKQNKRIIHANSIIPNNQPQTAKSFYDYTNIQDRCNGIIYSGGRHDGNVLLVYPQFIKGIIPLAITNDDGKTWKKIDTSDEAQKASYMSASKNMNIEKSEHKQIKDGKFIITKIENPDELNFVNFKPLNPSKENPVFEIRSDSSQRDYLDDYLDYLYVQKGVCCKGILDWLNYLSDNTLKFMGVDFLINQGYSFFDDNNSNVYFGKKIPDSPYEHRAKVVPFYEIANDLIKDGSCKKVPLILKTDGIIIYSYNGQKYNRKYGDDNINYDNTFYLVSENNTRPFIFKIYKMNKMTKYSFESLPSKQEKETSPKEVIDFIRKYNLKLDKNRYNNDNDFDKNLLAYRKIIAEILDKADLHNNARGKLVENYFGY